MATTIKLKNGSGAPLAGDLVQGEPALDLTNKRLYTEDSGGTVIEVGTNPTSLTTGTFTSTGIDDNATSTAITIDSSERIGIGTAIPDKKLDVLSGTANSDVAAFSGTATGRGLVISTFDDTGTNADAMVDFDAISGAGELSFSTGTTERMRIDSSGNVGIGTTNPVNTLVVSDGNDGLEFRTSLTDDNRILSYNRNTSAYTKMSLDAANYDIRVAGNVKATIDSSGNVGIGATSLSNKLTVNGDQVLLANGELKFADATNNQVGTIRNSGGASTSQLEFLTSSTERMRIDSSGNVGIGGSPVSSTRRLMVTDTGDVRIDIRSGSDTNLGAIDFSDTSNTARGQIIYDHNTDSMAFETLSTERMRIDSSGDVLVGNTLGALGLISTTTTEGFGIDASETYVAISRSNNGAALYLNKPGESTATAGDFIQCRQNGTNIGEIQYDGADLAIVQVSDQRLKSNIANSASAGSIIDAMQVRSFDWNDGVHVDYGFVAQELNQAYEPATKVGGDDVDEEPWGIKTQKLIPLLVKEIQDLRARVAQLEGA